MLTGKKYLSKMKPPTFHGWVSQELNLYRKLQILIKMIKIFMEATEEIIIDKIVEEL